MAFKLFIFVIITPGKQPINSFGIRETLKNTLLSAESFLRKIFKLLPVYYTSSQGTNKKFIIDKNLQTILEKIRFSIIFYIDRV